jgi:beta-lactamase class A
LKWFVLNFMHKLCLLIGLSTALLRGQSLDQKIRQATANFHGTTSLFAKNLDTGATYGLRENERVRTASTIKLAIMVTVFDAVEHGHGKWADKLTLHDSDKVGGTGVLFEFSDGLQFPIRDLMHLMIVLSDNTATNLLLDRFTADAVNAEMDSLGLPNTRCLRKILIGGKGPGGVSQAGRLEENQRYGLGVSTPREMVILMEKMEQDQLVSPAASREMIAILKRQQDKNGMGRKTGDLPVADKTGSLDHLRSDVGVVYTPGGRIAIAITVDDVPDVNYTPDNAGSIFISQLTGLLLDGLAKHENQRDPYPR